MNIVSLALNLLIPKAYLFEEATKNPIQLQKKVLFEYLARSRDTEYGRQYKFNLIKSVEEFQSAVPLSDCETMRPYLDRMAGGQQNVLTPDEPVFFGATSGTTSARKYIPTTKFSESKKAELLELWSYYIARDHPNTVKGKILAIVSPEVEGYTGSGVPYGAESGHGYKHLPQVVKHLYALPYEVFEIKDYDARYYAILRISMEHNITDIAALNPNILILLCQKIQRWQSTIIEDIDRGTLSEKFDIPEGIRRAIRLEPNSMRAQALESILKEKGELLPKYFWPDLELMECWKGGTMKIYLSQLEQYFGSVPIRDIGCLSTEARSSVPISDEGAGGVLAIGTNFYEFIPKEEINKRSGRPLLCDQLEKGKEYFIVVTTPGGLYRYNIDDIIRVDDFFNRTPVIEFVQKGLSTTSLAGEKLYESQVNEALSSVLRKTGLFVEFFCAVAQTQGSLPHYDFLVEFSGNTPDTGAENMFLKSVDLELQEQNSEYKYFREAGLLGGPVLKVVRPGDFEKFRAKRVAAGAHDGQFKVPELVSDAFFLKNFAVAEEIPLR